MQRSLKLAAAVAAATGLAAATPVSPADAYRVGISDQDAAMFDDPRYDSLGLKRVRYLVPWDYSKDAGQLSEVELFMQKARENGAEVLVTFTARRGCYTGRYRKTRACRAPSRSAYRKALRTFKRSYGIKVFSPWNEANHKSQPTYRKPKLAARYYNIARKNCKGCKIVALDVLDQGDANKYARAFRRAAKGRPRIWGLHNYGSVNRRRTKPTKSFLRTVRGQVWLTETGGIVKFGRSFRYSESRAAKRIGTMFRLANRYGKRRRGFRSKIGRVYVYKWYGEPRGARFDSGLIDKSTGEPRASFTAFERGIRNKPR